MKKFFAVLAVTLLASPANGQDFKVGLEAYDRGEYAAAIKEWQPLAERGDARAQLNLGVIHFNGEGVPHNPVKAVEWYRAAADQGYGPAQANLAFMYESGQGVLQNYIEAYKWATLAVAHGAQSAREARDRLAGQMTAEQITAATQAMESWRPRRAESAPEPKAEPAVKESAAVPAVDQIREVQRQLKSLGFDTGPADGIAGPRTRTAISAFQDQKGLPVTGAVTPELIALLSTEKKGDKPATPREQPLSREPAQPPAPTPRVAVARPVRAADCDRLAAHPADALLPPGVVGVTFENIDAKRAVAACELALARDSGHPRYQFQFARSVHKAERLEEAVTYYRQAGLQGHPLAQKSLGFAYANGLGVTRDYAKAAQWHHMAADQGDSDAQHNLGYLYAGGLGVGQDLIQAHMWYNIAAEHGSVGAANQLEQLAKRMTGSQINEAIRRAVDWFGLRRPAPGAQ